MMYLDAAATTPVRREVLEAMWPYLTGEFGNPSSRHELGSRAAEALVAARAQVAATLGCRPGEVTFTSGGTEADNLAVKGLALGAVDPARGRAARARHVVTTAIEHEAVLESVEHLRRWHGFEVTFVDVEPDGRVTPAALRAALRPAGPGGTALVSVHHANNEVGTVQDVAALAAVAHEAGALLHTDAVQSAAWLDVGLRALGADAVSVSGHKLGAPKGVGALAVRAGVPLEPLVHGGGQERGRRSGTENVAFAVGLGAALAGLTGRRARAADVAATRDALVAGVLRRVPGAVVTGPHPAAGTGTAAGRLPGHASFCFPGTSGEAVLLELERGGVLTSSGSACAAGRDEPSHVLTALGVLPEVAQTAVRLTFDAPLPDPEGLAGALAAAAGAVGALGHRPPPTPA
ncbi:cysteine desulfurase [Xylanimonas oleitrophica]|uniref:Cysteine desulfurase n=1 Tax=Xylanimonas oleitrophica TaxID=2607479 RepID=A0A2W5WWC5_9MICO|nr:cysteine desulfurase family protein [Xylanimonas oleitrophica]PZR52596.1 cysteine desulfurase [Xylanimonas oleitrophica]